MSADWQEVVLGDIATFSQGIQVPTEEQALCYEEGLGRFIRIVDYTNEAEPPRYIEKPSKKYYAASDDVVMVRYGSQTAGKIVRGKAGYIANNMFKINLNSSFIDKGYLFYFLGSDEIYSFLRSSQSSSTMPAITFGMLKPIIIRYPSLTLQRKIVSIVDGINNKIELNRQTNQTLEKIAQAIFKSWFVDFEPVNAKIAALEAGGGKEDALLAAMQAVSAKSLEQLRHLQSEKPRHYAELRAIAELFPSAMQDSELGEIPKGWSVSRIEDLVERLAVGKRYSQKTVVKSGSVPVLDQGRAGVIGYHNDEPSVRASIEHPVIVFANHTCFMRIIMHDFSAIQNVLPFKSKDLNVYWLYLATLGKQTFVEYKGHWPDFVIKDVVTPTNEIADRFGDTVKNLLITQYRNEQQSTVLSEVRETLLPKLLAGEIGTGSEKG